MSWGLSWTCLKHPITYIASPKSTNHIIDVADGSDENETDVDEGYKVEEDEEPAEDELCESITNSYRV